MTKYKLITNDNISNDDQKKLNTFYQICQFPNPYTKKYGIRKIYFNDKCDIVNIIEKEYDKHILNEFINHNKQSKYKIYPVREFNMLNYPSQNDFIGVSSSLIN